MVAVWTGHFDSAGRCYDRCYLLLPRRAPVVDWWRGRETAALSGHGRERIMRRIKDIREAAEAEPGFAWLASATGITVRNISAKVPGVTWVTPALRGPRQSCCM
jgi:hypothetical protein